MRIYRQGGIIDCLVLCIKIRFFVICGSIKKTQFPYIAIGKGIKINHLDLIQGKRTFTSLLMINPNKDIPIEKIYAIFDMVMKLYKK